VAAGVASLGATANFALTNNNPVPALTAISPNTGVLGQPVTLTLTGNNFIQGAVVNFGGNANTGGIISANGTTLTITITADQLGETGIINVTVTNPAPTAGPSAAQTFTITNSSASSNLMINLPSTVIVPVSTLTFSFNVQSVGGLAGIVNTTCASATVGCFVSPCPAPLTANHALAVTGTLCPCPPTGGSLQPFPRLQLPLAWRLALACLACLLLAGLISTQKKNSRWGLATGALTLALLAGCGGGSSSSSTPLGVAKGQYTLTITAKLGNVTQTAQVTVTVQ